MKGKEQPWKPCADCRWFHTEGKARGMRGQREEVEKVGREEGWVGGGRRRGGGEGEEEVVEKVSICRHDPLGCT